MASRTSNGLSTAEFLRNLEQREKKLRVKKTLCSDPFETRMLTGEMLKVQALIKRLKKLPAAYKAAGISAAVETM